jgi:nicotinate-nucleotide adenylyltransferase
MKIGVCGGTFDPFHRGHLDPVLAVREKLKWDRVIYVPAAKQPFKVDRKTTSSYHRFAMAVLGTQSNAALYVSPIELERGGTSYTIDTLTELHAMHPGSTFDWIIGDDIAGQLLTWKDAERLFGLARFVVLTRGGAVPAPALAERAASGRVIYANNQSVPISSTEIRKRVRAGEPIDLFVDPLVARYIQHYGLYKEVKR